MCKLPDRDIDCAACRPVTMSYGSLKQAQNEAFQEGITFIVERMIEVNRDAQSFEPVLFEGIARAHGMIFANVQLFEQPDCECRDVPECECKR